VRIEAGLATAFGCTIQGEVREDAVLRIAQACVEAGADRITLADTVGYAGPKQVGDLTRGAVKIAGKRPICVHLHDTRGMAIANAYAGLEMGVQRFDSSVAGLGGCPFAGHQGAAGNVCTEDLVFLCDELGIETGIDLDALIECARLAEDVVGHPLPGSVMKGGTLERFRRQS